MARTKRICPAGEVFHVLNRAVARLTIFEKPEDYAAFMRVVACSLQDWWHGASVSGALQIVPDSNGRALADRDAVRGAKSRSCKFR